jgi:endonuclease/exonuclease/phosphatase family metal-dependent hydrolase
MKLRTVGACAVTLAAMVLTGCTDTSRDVVDDATVRVMQFNIEYGGTVVDFDSVPAAIEAADADVVAVQEAYGHTCRIARALDWDYCDPRTQTLSRLPLITPADPTAPEVLVAVEPGRAFAVINVHLPSAPYGPNKAAAGASADELVAAETGRLEALEPALEGVVRLEAAGLPVVVTGDFNTPSHRDWTDATTGLRDHVIPVEWPVTRAVEESGLVDAYRTVHPDPVADEGLTWPAARPKAGSYNPGLSGRPADRIDMTFASADITTVSAEILGEPGAEATDIAVEPWPTDHRAVVSELRVPLGDTGPYVSPVQRLVDQGETVDLLVAAESLAQEVVVHGAGTRLTLPLEDDPHTLLLDWTRR